VSGREPSLPKAHSAELLSLIRQAYDPDGEPGEQTLSELSNRGWDTNHQRLAVSMTWEPLYEWKKPRSANFPAVSALPMHEQDAVLEWGERHWLFLKWIEADRSLDEQLQTLQQQIGRLNSSLDPTAGELHTGIGRFHNGRDGTQQSIMEAVSAMRCRPWMRLKEPFLHYDEDTMIRFVQSIPYSTTSEEHLKAAEMLAQQKDWFQTVRIFFLHNHRLRDTGDRMFLAGNSVTYRLNQVTSNIGLDPRRYSDAAILRSAMVLHSLQAGETI